MCLGMVAPHRPGAGDPMVQPFAPAGQIGAGAAGPAPMTVPLRPGTFGRMRERGPAGLRPDRVECDLPATCRRDRIGIFEAVLAEGGKLDREVDHVGGPNCRPGAECIHESEHRFVL